MQYVLVSNVSIKTNLNFIHFDHNNTHIFKILANEHRKWLKTIGFQTIHKDCQFKSKLIIT